MTLYGVSQCGRRKQTCLMTTLKNSIPQIKLSISVMGIDVGIMLMEVNRQINFIVSKLNFVCKSLVWSFKSSWMTWWWSQFWKYDSKYGNGDNSFTLKTDVSPPSFTWTAKSLCYLVTCKPDVTTVYIGLQGSTFHVIDESDVYLLVHHVSM